MSDEELRKVRGEYSSHARNSAKRYRRLWLRNRFIIFLTVGFYLFLITAAIRFTLWGGQSSTWQMLVAYGIGLVVLQILITHSGLNSFLNGLIEQERSARELRNMHAVTVRSIRAREKKLRTGNT